MANSSTLPLKPMTLFHNKKVNHNKQIISVASRGMEIDSKIENVKETDICNNENKGDSNSNKEEVENEKYQIPGTGKKLCNSPDATQMSALEKNKGETNKLRNMKEVINSDSFSIVSKEKLNRELSDGGILYFETVSSESNKNILSKPYENTMVSVDKVQFYHRERGIAESHHKTTSSYIHSKGNHETLSKRDYNYKYISYNKNIISRHIDQRWYYRRRTRSRSYESRKRTRSRSYERKRSRSRSYENKRRRRRRRSYESKRTRSSSYESKRTRSRSYENRRRTRSRSYENRRRTRSRSYENRRRARSRSYKSKRRTRSRSYDKIDINKKSDRRFREKNSMDRRKRSRSRDSRNYDKSFYRLRPCEISITKKIKKGSNTNLSKETTEPKNGDRFNKIEALELYSENENKNKFSTNIYKEKLPDGSLSLSSWSDDSVSDCDFASQNRKIRNSDKPFSPSSTCRQEVIYSKYEYKKNDKDYSSDNGRTKIDLLFGETKKLSEMGLEGEENQWLIKERLVVQNGVQVIDTAEDGFRTPKQRPTFKDIVEPVLPQPSSITNSIEWIQPTPNLFPTLSLDNLKLVPGREGLPVHITDKGEVILHDLDGRRIPIGPDGHYLPLNPNGRLFAHVVSPDNTAIPIYMTDDGVLRLPNFQPVPYGPFYNFPVNIDGKIIAIGPDSKPLETIFPSLPRMPSYFMPGTPSLNPTSSNVLKQIQLEEDFEQGSNFFDIFPTQKQDLFKDDETLAKESQVKETEENNFESSIKPSTQEKFKNESGHNESFSGSDMILDSDDSAPTTKPIREDFLQSTFEDHEFDYDDILKLVMEALDNEMLKSQLGDNLSSVEITKNIHLFLKLLSEKKYKPPSLGRFILPKAVPEIQEIRSPNESPLHRNRVKLPFITPDPFQPGIQEQNEKISGFQFSFKRNSQNKVSTVNQNKTESVLKENKKKVNFLNVGTQCDFTTNIIESLHLKMRELTNEVQKLTNKKVQNERSLIQSSQVHEN